MKTKTLLEIFGALVLALLASAGPAFGQLRPNTATPLPTSAKIAVAIPDRAASSSSAQPIAPQTPRPKTPSPPPQPPTYAVIDLGTLGGPSSEATGINASGQIVGLAITSSGQIDPFLYSNRTMQDLWAGGGYAMGINNSGQVVGWTNGEDGAHAVLFANNSIQYLGTFFSPPSEAYAINTSGQITGTAEVQYDNDAFLYGNASMENLGTLGGGTSVGYAINDSGQVVGQSVEYNSAGNTAFLYSGGALLDLGVLGGSDRTSCACGIDAAGDIVGYSATGIPGEPSHAFFYPPGGPMQDIDTVGSSDSVALAINNNGQIVGTVQNGIDQHAMLYMGGQMYDLNNLLVFPNSGWELREASAINDAGQIVGVGINPSGQGHAFLLNPIPAGAGQASSTTQSSLPTYGDLPAPEPGKDSLVVVTHGWIRSATTLMEASEFVDTTSASIADYLAAKNVNNWQVYGIKWLDEAYTFTPMGALSDGQQQGTKLGDAIVALGANGWKNIHFIAHSAGGGLIQTAANIIKKVLGSSVTIHCTFLDAYDGLYGEMANLYGLNTDWADSYFVRDQFQQVGSTGRVLPNAYNVDVTALDPQAAQGVYFANDPYSDCLELQSNHGWPNEFYANSIEGAIMGNQSSFANEPYYGSFGFPLSVEANAQLSTLKGQYPPGNGLSYGSVIILGNANGTCIPPYLPPPLYLGTIPDYSAASTLRSTTGTLSTSTGYAQATTGSPVWLATVITDTNALNFVSFDAEFTSASGADGLLTVYWDTNMIGEVDETAVQTGLQHYNFTFPNTAPNSSHILGFHVDPFAQVHSTLVLTNIVTGCVGVSQPFSLAITTSNSTGLLAYQLNGQPAVYIIQASQDLVNWTNIASIVNMSGSASFVDVNSTNHPYQFYRATSLIGLTQ